MTHFAQAARLILRKKISAGILEQSMGVRNREGNFSRNRVVVPARKATAGEIDSWAPLKFKNNVSET
jgi:hypothetical protein